MKRFASLVALAVGVLAVLVTPAGAWMPPSPVQNLLFRAKDPADLRAQLRAHRDSVGARDSLDAGEAWYWLGVSHGRSGELEDAIAAFRRSLAIRGNPEDVTALADALLLRGRRADGEEAVRLLEASRRDLEGDRGPRGAAVRLRAAWAQAVAGDGEAAAAAVTARRTDLLAPRARPASWTLWASRFAPVLMRSGRNADGWALLAPLLAASRGRDTSLVGLARDSRAERPFTEDVAVVVAREALRADSLLAASVPGVTLKRVNVRAEDGARLAAWVWPAGPRAPLALVVLAPESPAYGDADSLLWQLHRAGISVALLDPRGSRASASAAAPLPHVWLGREDVFHRRLARDISAALTPAIAATGADPSRVLVVSEGPTVIAAALAARDDARVRALLMASAAPSGAERGWLRATLTAAGAPVFFQQGPEDVYGNEVVDRIASLLPPRSVRVADSQWSGHGVALFRAGPATAQRLSDWLRSEWKSRPATPRARRR